jgi:hypothetical protein
MKVYIGWEIAPNDIKPSWGLEASYGVDIWAL